VDNDPSLASAPPSVQPDVPASAARWRQRDVADTSPAHADLRPDAPPDTRPPADAPERAGRDAELWLLARRSHGAALRVDLLLRTTVVRQVFRRDFVYVSRLLHALEASRRVRGLERGELDEALATLQRRADDVHELLQRARDQLQAVIASHPSADAELAFVRPARFQATVVCPSAQRYLALLSQADDTLAHLEMAWLLGLVAPADRAALASDCRRALKGFKDLAAERRQAIGDQVRAVNAQRRDGPAMVGSG